MRAAVQVLTDLAGAEGGAVLDRLKNAIAGTAALHAQLTESEAANYELAGMVKELNKRLTEGSSRR